MFAYLHRLDAVQKEQDESQELKYQGYAAFRTSNPTLPPEHMQGLFDKDRLKAYEERYQKELIDL